jgi:hypothetical protein
MAIVTTKPTVVPAHEEKVYDQVWVRRLVIQAPNPNGKVNANVNLVNYRDVEVEVDGKMVARREQAPGDGTEFRILDVYNQAEYNPDQLAVLLPLLEAANDNERIGLLATMILTVTEAEAKKRGLI